MYPNKVKPLPFNVTEAFPTGCCETFITVPVTEPDVDKVIAMFCVSPSPANCPNALPFSKLPVTAVTVKVDSGTLRNDAVPVGAAIDSVRFSISFL